MISAAAGGAPERLKWPRVPNTIVYGNEKRHGDGRVDLIDNSRIEESPLANRDLLPVPIARRTWTTYNYAALWISMYEPYARALAEHLLMPLPRWVPPVGARDNWQTTE